MFGEALGLCQPNGVKVHLPFTIQHDPPGRRDPISEIKAPSVNLNKVLAATLSSFGPGIPSTDPASNIPLLGTYLQQLANLPTDDFAQYAADATRRVYVETLKSLKEATQGLTAFPEYYQEDVRAFEQCLSRAIDDRRTFVPIDLGGSSDEVWAFVQELFGRYADLLKHWPAIVDAARRWRGDWQD